MRKVLLYSINDYQTQPDLAGCYNDNRTAANYIRDRLNVDGLDIRLLTGQRCRKQALIERVNWLVDGAKPGDWLGFGGSSHGLKFPERDPISGRIIRNSQAVAMWDFDWTPETCVRDFEFLEIFSRLPQGCLLTWINDSCYSGGMTMHRNLRAASGSWYETRARTILPNEIPLDMQWRLETAEAAGLASENLISKAAAAGKIPFQYISGCGRDEVSADLRDPRTGRAYGAMSQSLFDTLWKEPVSTPLKRVIEFVNRELDSMNLGQHPQVEGVYSDVPFGGPIP